MTQPSAADSQSVRNRIHNLLVITDPTLTPPLKGKISIEINNGCNHFCYSVRTPRVDDFEQVIANT